MRRCRVLVPLALVCVSGCGKSTTVTVVTPPAAATLSLPDERVYRVPAGSMEPTLTIGAHVLVRPITTAPTVGDIVVFHPPNDAQETSGGAAKCGPAPHVVTDGTVACDAPVPSEASVNFIKRVVAGPGDVISIVEGHVIRNGKRESDSYIKPCVTGDPKCNFPTPITIPSGEWFMLGDNRGESDDSRFWGPVPTNWIVGVARPCSDRGITCEATQ
jgi:signal peptidase I